MSARFEKVLVANRGAIACRVFRTLGRMGIGRVAVYSDADRHAAHVGMADVSVRLGPPPAAESYLDPVKIIDACRTSGAAAVHPGYGFLSENPDFAEALAGAGLRFIGPRPEHMRVFGRKHTARDAASACGVPILPGTALLDSVLAATAEARRVGFPLMIKSTAGGGGIGLQLCRTPEELPGLFENVRRLSRANFAEDGVFLERWVERARHIEVQIFGDGRGEVIALGERDCSLQRRNQKVIEETPAPRLPERTRAALLRAAVDLGKHVAYESAGTVEFIYDDDADEFFFLEVNTRLQVEHGVTEEVTGVDLVEWMVRQAAGDLPALAALAPTPRGASIQARLYAEDPGKGFLPCAGLLTHVALPADVRVDGWVETGTEVTPFYDPMLAKIIARGDTRDEAIERLRAALAATEVHGIETNLDFLREIAGSELLASGRVSTRALGEHVLVQAALDVVAPGAQSSLQDWPGRTGTWDVGVPPSGPMDPLSHRLANAMLGNPSDAATLEMTLTGATLRFRSDTQICLAGAAMDASLAGEPVPYWCAVPVAAGETLTLGSVRGAGQRTYLAIRHGFDAPLYLGSRATFALGRFGGHATGCLRAGDVLHVRTEGAGRAPGGELDPALRTPLVSHWEIGALYGPHGAPDFFTEKDVATLFDAEYEVHYNSARTGVRLIGPRPEWARADGGEAGLHPSNLHDNAYAVGTLDFTGDMPILLGPDGPSLGGFVCPLTVAQSELWKLGQLRPGDRVRFRRLDRERARLLRAEQDRAIATLRPAPKSCGPVPKAESPILLRTSGGGFEIVLRQAGEDCLLVEIGDAVLDLTLRLQAHVLMERIRAAAPRGLIDLTPGIRSLQLHFDGRVLSMDDACALVRREAETLPPVDALEVPSRIVHLPLSWNDEAIQLAVRKYQELVRPDAPWCPSNIEFIRRINALADEAAVRETIFAASYLVLGLGDVYLGAPVATPLDPRHRLVTTKYNPARTWTPENAVGIGGAYLCIYGMEGPGGYQLFGRTIQVWNTWRSTPSFAEGHPWLLRFFDQIRFFPVDAAELLEAREAFPHGAYPVRIEESTFSFASYRRFLEENDASITAFRTRQREAFLAERERWRESGLATFVADEGGPLAPDEDTLPDGHAAAVAAVPGNVWKVLVAPGDRVAPGQVVVLLESMKMEMEVIAPVGGVVSEVSCRVGRTVAQGQRLLSIEAA